MLSLVIIKSLKIKISLNESVKDRTRCAAIQGFVRSIPNFDRTLSVDQPLFAALHLCFLFVNFLISLRIICPTHDCKVVALIFVYAKHISFAH